MLTAIPVRWLEDNRGWRVKSNLTASGKVVGAAGRQIVLSRIASSCRQDAGSTLNRCGLRTQHARAAVPNTMGPARHGWTLIESIAVLAVIAILAAFLVPSIIKRVDRAAWTKETAELNAIADALSQSIVRTKTIPSDTGWEGAVADQMALPVSAITTNSRRYARAFLIDPDFRINDAALPYSQDPSGATTITSARVIILSSLFQALPIASGVPSAADFNNIWNAPENTVPAGSPFTGWAATGEDLRIKKLNIEPLFHQLILFNHDPANADPSRDAPFSFDGGTTQRVPAASAWNRYYLESSDLWLLDSNFNLRTRYLIRRSIGFIFESGSWRGQIQGGETFTNTNSGTASDFLKLATVFYNAPVNTGAGAGASPSSVLATMYTFMFDYVFWATQCPSFGWHGNGGGTPSNLPEYRMLNDMGQNSGGVDKYSGSSGLLK